MTIPEQLAAIRAKCEALLRIASDRTHGNWNIGEFDNDIYSPEAFICETGSEFSSSVQDVANAEYIAACAGAAEAGWRTTIAAIDTIENIKSLAAGAKHPAIQTIHDLADMQQTEIIAAWQEEIQ